MNYSWVRLRGNLQENVDVSKLTWYGVGGPIDLLYEPADIEDLALFLKQVPSGTPITILGAMSNVLIRSGGIRGIAIRLTEWFKRTFIQDNIIEIGAAATCSALSIFAMDHELGGLEFLAGIPGSIGGAIKMNAGCFGSDIFNYLQEFECVDFEGSLKWIKARDVKYFYRGTNISPALIITRAWFRGEKEVDYIIPKKVRQIVSQKHADQPLDKKSCGSVFKNPEGCKAWELIDAAGCRGMKIGGAKVSDKHCNFIINDGDASADDIEDLGNKIVEMVQKHSGITLEWEVIRLGERKSE